MNIGRKKMKQIDKQYLCFYCMGCMKEELETFEPVMRCKNFIPEYADWQEQIRKELKKK